jgi:hypothetical protein
VKGVHVFTTTIHMDSNSIKMFLAIFACGSGFASEGMPLHYDGIFGKVCKAMQRDPSFSEADKLLLRELMAHCNDVDSPLDLAEHTSPSNACTIRMVVFELEDKSLLIVSPTRLLPEVKEVLDKLGPVAYVVGTSGAHRRDTVVDYP